LGCGPLIEQARYLITVIRNSDGKEVTDMTPQQKPEHLATENDYGIGPVGGGIYGPAWMELGNEGMERTPLSPIDEAEKVALLELPVGPVESLC
jgi:hypothetical protein